jgi:hypothetical protein
MTGMWPNYHMYMIRHHTPSQNIVSLALKVMKRVLDDLCNLRVPEHTFSLSGIEKRFNSCGMQLAQPCGFVGGQLAAV